MERQAPVIELSGLTVGYDQPILKDIDLEIGAGVFWGVIGANGIGKSTLLKTICGILPPLGGSVVIDGQPITQIDLKSRSLKIALVSAESFEAGNFTVFDIAAFGRYPHLGYLGSLDSNDRDIIHDYLDLFGLIPLKNKRFREISQGEAQRCLIARAMIQETPYIFLDEPLNHLDLHHQIDVLGLLHRKASSEKKSVLIISHEIKLTCLLADSLMIIQRDGSIMTGKTESVMSACALDGAFEWTSGYFDYPSYSLEIYADILTGQMHPRQALIRGHNPQLILVARYLLKNGIIPRIDSGPDSYLGFWAASLGLNWNSRDSGITSNESDRGDSGIVPNESDSRNCRSAGIKPEFIILEKGLTPELTDSEKNVPVLEFDRNAHTLIDKIEKEYLFKT